MRIKLAEGLKVLRGRRHPLIIRTSVAHRLSHIKRFSQRVGFDIDAKIGGDLDQVALGGSVTFRS